MPDDAMTDDQLRQWAEHNQSHSAAARGVLRLLAEIVDTRALLSRPNPLAPTMDIANPIYAINWGKIVAANEKPDFDGSTGTPDSGVAGHKSDGSGT